MSACHAGMCNRWPGHLKLSQNDRAGVPKPGDGVHLRDLLTATGGISINQIPMEHILDLHIEREILPLFDFVHNEFARNCLVQFFSEVPESLEEILLRQEIIKTLMGKKVLHEPFIYYKSEIHEIVDYVKQLENRSSRLGRSSLSIHLFFNNRERKRDGTRLGQLVLFFYKIQQFYFASLEKEDFPLAFGKQIMNIKRFLRELQVAKYQEIAMKRSFRIREVTKLLSFALEKIANGEMEVFLKDFFQFEAYLSVSKGVIKQGFVFPVFNGSFSMTDLYHPLLKKPVKNSLKTQHSVTLITGPNMSGKSTLLKGIGICVFLAHLGLAVPASQCELPFFDDISVSINLNDDLESGFSHFMTEIKSLKKVVTKAANGKRCFAVFDELFRGTNMEDALPISKTTILGLTKFKDCYFFMSTHLHQLKEDMNMAGAKITTRYIECQLVNNKPVFTYRLMDGSSDLKIGQILFEQEGLNRLLG
jgi:DNA mismatch repair protein MutS